MTSKCIENNKEVYFKMNKQKQEFYKEKAKVVGIIMGARLISLVKNIAVMTKNNELYEVKL